MVEERGVAVARGDGQGGLAQRGIDGGGIGQIILRDLAGLGEDGGILAVVAEDAEEAGRAIRGCWRESLRGRSAELGVLRRKGGANPGRERGLLFRCLRNTLIGRVDASQGGAYNLGVGIGS